jgi:hypothetical protein
MLSRPDCSPAGTEKTTRNVIQESRFDCVTLMRNRSEMFRMFGKERGGCDTAVD